MKASPPRRNLVKLRKSMPPLTSAQTCELIKARATCAALYVAKYGKPMPLFHH